MGLLRTLFGRKDSEADFIRASMERYVRPNQVKELLKAPSSPPEPKLKTRMLYCLLIQVRDDTVEQVQLYDAQAISIYLKHDGILMHLMGSVHFVTFGAFDDTNGADLNNFRAAIAELQATFGDDIRIVAFSGEMSIGNFGNSDHMSFTTLAPNFGRFLKALVDMDFGQISELSA